MRPVRVADRGAVASLVLPFCYVAVPYLLGLLVLGAQAYGMARYGPSTRTAVPPDWTDARAGSGTGPRSTQPARRDRSPGQ